MAFFKNRKILILFALIAIVLIAFPIYVMRKISSDNLVSTLQSKIQKYDAGLEISADSALTEMSTYSFKLKGVHLKKRDQQSDALLFRSDFPSIEIQNFRLWRYILFDELQIYSLDIIADSVLFYSVQSNTKTDSVEVLDRRKQFESLLSKLRNRYDRIQFDQIRLSVSQIKFDKGKGVLVDAVQAEVNNLNFDRTKHKIDFGKFDVQIQNVIDHRAPFEQTSIDSITLDLSQSEVEFFGIVHQPTVLAYKYHEHVPFQKNWMTIKLDKLSLNRVRFERLLLDKELWIGRSTAHRAKISSYKDKRLKESPQGKRLPHDLLSNLDFPIRIDTFSVNRIDVIHSEHAASGLIGRAGAGRLFFDRLEVFATNISNIDSLMPAKINAGGLLNNRAPISLSLSYDFSKKDAHFDFSGKLSFCDAYLLNDLTRPNLRLQFDSGIIDQLSFDGKVRKNKSQGDISLKYSDLKISVLKQEKMDKRKLVSLLGNWAISNSTKSTGSEQADFSYELESSVGFLGVIWKSLQQGLMQVVIQDRPRKMMEKRTSK